MCFLRVRAHRYAVSQRLLDLLRAAFFATAPPALLSLPRTSAAATELLFRNTAAACKRFRDAYAQMQAPTKPGKLVHHHASTWYCEALPEYSSTRRKRDQADASCERTDPTRNPH